MTSPEYRATLAALGLTQVAGGKLLGVTTRTSQRWASGEREVPAPAARFLRLLLVTGISPHRARQLLDA